MLGRLRLGTRISLITGLVVFLAFALTTWTLSTASAALSRRQSFDLAQSMAGEYANRVDAMLEVAIDAARTLAHSFEGMKGAELTNRRVGNEVLRRVLEDNSEFVGVWTCWEPNAFDGADQSFVSQAGHDGTGRYIPYWNRDGASIRLDPLLGYDKEGEGDYYLLAKKANEEVITPPYPYQIGGVEVLITSLVVPVRHRGLFVGVCGVDIPLATIQQLVNQIRPHQTGFAALISHEGRYAAHPDIAQLNRDVGLLPADEQIKAAIRANTPLRLPRTLAGNEFYTTVVPLAVGRTKTPWGFLVNVPIDAVLAPSREVRNTILLIGALALVAVLVVLPPVYRRLVTSPVSRVTGVAQTIAAGDLVEAHRVLESFDAGTRKREDEIGRLVDAFDIMVRNLSSLANQVQASALHVSFSSAEISSGSKQLEASSHEQAASAREVTATTRLISDTSDKLVTTMDSAARDLAAAVGQAELGREALQGLQTAMAQLVDSTASISSKLSVISGRANRISDVVTTMNKISDRTNVLALNAAIEAEKAGEYGRGFSVVSREIGRLNDQTAIATDDISAVIREMQSSVSAGLMEMEKFAHGVRQSTEGAGRIGIQLTALIDKVQSFAPLFNSITGGMHQQSEGAQQISEAISQLSTAADETQGSLMEFKQVMENLNKATLELQREAGRFKALADDSPGFSELPDTGEVAESETVARA